MKYFLSLLLIFSSVMALATESTHFLSEETFKSLSREDQALYIRTVQRILATMSKQTLFMAGSEGPSDSRMPAASLLTEKSTPTALEIKLKNDAKMKALVKEEPAYVQALNASLEPFMEERRPTNASSSRVNPTPQKIEEAAATLPSPTSAPASVTTPAPAPSPVPVPVPAAAAVAPAPAPTPKPALAPQAKASTPTPAAPAKKKPASDEAKKETKERGNYRCMYAGWVVTDHPCKGVNKLPTGWEIRGTDASKMTCAEDKTMCNPFVFGLRLEKPCKSMDEKDCSRKATPICVNKGAWPTETCYKQSTFEDALVAADIQDSREPIKFKTYTELFKDLCDKEQIEKNKFADPKYRSNKSVTAEAVKRDITITCEWAKKKLELANDAFNIRAEGGKAADKKAWADKKGKAEKETKTQK